MSDLPSKEELQAIEEAFAGLDFGDFEIVDKLRDVTLDGVEDGVRHFIGKSFASVFGSESFLVSFHCLLDRKCGVVEAYAYECRNGTEVANKFWDASPG